MQHRIIFMIAILSTALLAGCGAIREAEVAEAQAVDLPTDVAGPVSGDAEVVDAAAVNENGFDGCPVTLPARQAFRPSLPYPPTYPYDGRSWYGADSLWTALPEDGRWSQLLHGDKVFWWRAGYSGSAEPQPDLWMTAKRLDGDDVIGTKSPATNAYHADFHWAMLSGLQAPAAGCWEVTGHYRTEGVEQTLRFVVWVGD